MKPKFQIGDLLPIAMTFVVLGIGIAFGLNVMGSVRDEFSSGTSPETNATNMTIAAVELLAGRLGIIMTVIVAAVLIGILVRYLFKQFA